MPPGCRRQVRICGSESVSVSESECESGAAYLCLDFPQSGFGIASWYRSLRLVRLVQECFEMSPKASLNRFEKPLSSGSKANLRWWGRLAIGSLNARLFVGTRISQLTAFFIGHGGRRLFFPIF